MQMSPRFALFCSLYNTKCRKAWLISSASHVTPESDSKRGKRRVQVSNPRSSHKTIPSIFKQNIMDTAGSLTKSCKRLEPCDRFFILFISTREIAKSMFEEPRIAVCICPHA